MSGDERGLLNVLFLAAQSHRKKQAPGRDRFLMLTLIAACRAGFPEIADQCRKQIVLHSPHHLLNQFNDAIEAMQSEEFQIFSKQVQRFCTAERAEQLAQGLGFHAEKELKKYDGDCSQLAGDLLASIQQENSV